MIERAVVDGSSSCRDQAVCGSPARGRDRPPSARRAARRGRATAPGRMLGAAAVAGTTARGAIAPRARRGRGVPATRRTRVFARAGGDDDADDDADDAPTPAGKLDGGKYGMGGRIDDALDASTNETSFVLGGFLLTLSAIALFAFGPRPPTEY